MRTARLLCIVLLVLGFTSSTPSAQSLSYDLFARYIGPLREQAGIPGLSAAITLNGRLVWDQGFGVTSLESPTPVTIDTPFPLGDLTQVVSSTALLRRCVEGGEFGLDDRVQRWNHLYREQFTTFRQLLSHNSSIAPYAYNAARYADLTPAIEECVDQPFTALVAAEFLDRLGMTRSVPGNDVVFSGTADGFSEASLARYRSLLDQVAVPYRVDSKAKATRSTYARTPLTAGTGLISTVADLARFDDALDDGVLLRSETRSTAWRPVEGAPMGLGWFVQTYNNQRVVWHFGVVKDAYSSLLIKLPDSGLTLYMLANSDGLTAPYPLAAGDVTVSPFARVFLRFID